MKAIRIWKSYGNEVDVIKLEWVNHIKKRMGTRLRKFKKKFGKGKLEEGKGLEGKNRLTYKQINKLQNYYCLAIKRGGSNVLMKNETWGMRRIK